MRESRAGVLSFALSLWLGMAGCIDQEPEIVPADDETDRWTLRQESRIEGDGGGSPLSVPYRVRQVTLVGDRTVVAHQSGLVVFNRAGRFERFLAPIGDGPGEVRLVTTMAVADGETLLAFDAGRKRVVAYDPGGSVGEAFRVPVSRVNRNIGIGLAHEAIYLTQSPMERAAGRSPVLVRDSVSLLRVDSRGSVDTLGILPGPPILVANLGQGASYLYAPLRPLPQLTTWSGGSLFTNGADNRIEVRDHRGTVVRILETGRAPLPLTAQRLDSWKDERRARVMSQGGVPYGKAEEAIYPFGVEPEWPELLPVYQQLIPANGDCFLAGVHETPGDPGSVYDVIHVERGRVAEIEVPAAVTLHDLAPTGRVAAVERGRFDEEIVRVFQVEQSMDGVCG